MRQKSNTDLNIWVADADGSAEELIAELLQMGESVRKGAR
jgi:hypothetical protein